MPWAFVMFFVLLALGYLAQKSGRFPDSAADTLNRFVIDVCLPALVLRMVPALELKPELLVLALTPWLLCAVAYGLVQLGARLFRWDVPTRAVLFLCMALGNTSFLGFPVCSALLGEPAVALAVVYDQFGSFLMLSSVGLLTVARASGGAVPGAREMAQRVLVFPPFLALIVALVPFHHPDWLDAMLLQISNALVPTAIFAVGLKTRITPPKARSAFLFGLTAKMGLMPLLAWGVSRAFHAPLAVVRVNVLEAGMPPMITAAALAMAAGIAPELSAALVGWGILLSLITLRAWFLVVG
jgi:predicted permease